MTPAAREKRDADLETKLAQKFTNYVSAWDERQRLFNAMRRADLLDTEREEILADYLAAAKHFEKLRAEIGQK